MRVEYLPPVSHLIHALEEVMEVKGPLYANAFLIHFIAYALNMWLSNLIEPHILTTYFGKVYEAVVEGSFDLDKDVVEIVAILSEGVSEIVYDEVMSKVAIILKDLV